MKNTRLLLFAAGLSLFAACKEKGPAINFGSSAVASDTTYMAASTPAAQQRVVVAEEFTGATCPNCPAARDKLTAISDNNAERVITMEIHINDFPQSKPAHGSKYDLRTDDGTAIGSTFYNPVNFMPSAGISRIGSAADKRLLSSGDWAKATEDAMAVAPPVNVVVKSTYDASSKNATITVTVTYTKPVSKQQFLSLAILEDHIVDIQEYPTSFEDNYEFMHTLRDLVTPVSGDQFLADMPTKDAGRVYERTFIYPVNATWNPDNCKVVAFVHHNEADSKEILQAAETELAGK